MASAASDNLRQALQPLASGSTSEAISTRERGQVRSQMHLLSCPAGLQQVHKAGLHPAPWQERLEACSFTQRQTCSCAAPRK